MDNKGGVATGSLGCPPEGFPHPAGQGDTAAIGEPSFGADRKGIQPGRMLPFRARKTNSGKRRSFISSKADLRDSAQPQRDSAHDDHFTHFDPASAKSWPVARRLADGRDIRGGTSFLCGAENRGGTLLRRGCCRGECHSGHMEGPSGGEQGGHGLRGVGQVVETIPRSGAE